MSPRIIITIAVALAGCDQNIVEQLCARGDECNALPSSENECVDAIGACVDRLSPAQRDEWEYEIQQCLDRPSCGAAFDCYLEVPGC